MLVDTGWYAKVPEKACEESCQIKSTEVQVRAAMD
jgi:hypothetical protein